MISSSPAVPLDLHGQQVAMGCAFVFQRQPFGLLFLHFQQLGLDIVVG